MSETVKRYSEAFKRHVVREYEEGATILDLRRKYGIGGGSTIQRWIRKYGRDGLRHQIVRIQTAEEANQVRHLQQELRRVQEALGRVVVEKLALEETLALYQETYGSDLVKKTLPAHRSHLPGSPKTRT